LCISNWLTDFVVKEVPVVPRLGSLVACPRNYARLIVVLAALLSLAGHVEAACPTFAYCTAYATGTVVTYNGSNYTAVATIAATRDCSGYTPPTDNWWAAGGACGATPTATSTTRPTATSTTRPTATYTATATSTPRATATTGRATATYTSTATARATATGARATATTARATATYTSTATATNAPRATATSTSTATNTPTPTATPTPSGPMCNYPDWVAGHPYVVGDIVKLGGLFYITVNDNAGLDPTVSTWYWAPYTPSCLTPTPTSTATPSSSGIATIVSASAFDLIWPPTTRAATYTFVDFVAAADSYYPALCGTGDINVKKRECAAYFANKSQETGTGRYDRELYCQPGGAGYGTSNCDYCDVSDCGTCASGQQYWGRHSIQLSWAQNYCKGGKAIGLDTALLADPNQIFNNRVTGWRLANWYWMTQLGPTVSNGYGAWPSQTAHDAITLTDASGNYGLGGTIRAINGGIECGSRVAQQINRVTFYNGSGDENDEDGSGGILGILGYGGGTFGRRYCAP
jgi:Chitinase class I